MHIIFNPLGMFVVGSMLGFLSKALDIYTSNLGNMFSKLSVWILIGVIISIYSQSRKLAMRNMFTFCIGMLITYYLYAHMTHGVYGISYIVGWTAFSLVTPIFAYITWMSKEKGMIPMTIKIMIIVVTLLISVVLYNGPKIDDMIIVCLLYYLLFVVKVERSIDLNKRHRYE